MPPAKPSLDLLRSMTDEHVLRLLMEQGRLTRADIAVRSGISKTTISESMRRLAEVGLVVDTGERTTGRGRSGSLYALAGSVGSAVVASISPAGVVAERVDAVGQVTRRVELPLGRAAGAERAAQALAAAVTEVKESVAVRVTVVSAADPVDRETGRLVQLPDAPFLVGDLDPVGVLTAVLGGGEVLVDNDVHWAARAERASGCAVGVDDFVHLHLGEGLGCAVVSDGEVRRGHRGVAGEIAHVVTAGPSGAAMPLTRVFAELGLRRSGSTAIDVDALAAADDRTTAALADAVSGVCLAAIAFGDPQLLVLGGPWGRRPAFVELIRERARGWPRRVSVEASTLEGAPELLGARLRAVELLRSAVVEDSGRARRTAP